MTSPGTEPSRLPVSAPSPRVADHDEVGFRVVGRFEKDVGGLSGDHPLLHFRDAAPARGCRGALRCRHLDAAGSRNPHSPDPSRVQDATDTQSA